MSNYLESARVALKLFRKGKDIQEIKVKLGERYAVDVRRKINVACMELDFEEPELTSDELALVMNVGRIQRIQLTRGETCSPKLKWCAAAFWPNGKAERIARKRLGKHRASEDPQKPGTGLGLLHHYHGGYVQLTPAGWSLFHAIDAERARGKAQ
jgi:hypothetical protein